MGLSGDTNKKSLYLNVDSSWPHFCFFFLKLPRQNSVYLSSITSHLLFLKAERKRRKKKKPMTCLCTGSRPPRVVSVRLGFSTVHCPSSPRQSEIGLPKTTTTSACRSIDRGTNSFHSGLGMTTTGMEQDWTTNLGGSVVITVFFYFFDFFCLFLTVFEFF